MILKSSLFLSKFSVLKIKRSHQINYDRKYYYIKSMLSVLKRQLGNLILRNRGTRNVDLMVLE